MNTKQLVLKLVLECAEQPLSVDSLDDRMLIQKAVYLLQEKGADLGYRHSWYLKGPYSTNLTQDYFAVNEAIKDGTLDGQRKLNPDFATKVRTAAQVLKKPVAVKLDKPSWYELLASIHYLLKKDDKAPAQMRKTMAEKKPHLVGYIDAGIAHLQKHSLI